MPKIVALAALQPLSAVDRVAFRTRNDPQARQAHFMQYNIKASTYNEDYCRRYGEEYFRYLEGWLLRAAERGVEFLLLPELAFDPGVISAPVPEIPVNPHFFADALRLYRWAEDYFLTQLARITDQTGMMIGASISSVRDERLYNAGIIVDGGAPIFRYEKVHLAPSEEEDYFTAGETFPVAETRLGRFGYNICYDIQFPEAFACCAAAGAEVVLHPSLGYTLPDEDPDMGCNRLRVRASDHYCAVIYSSFAQDRGWRPGYSRVIAQNGSVLAALSARKSGIAIGQVEIGRKRRWPSDSADAPDRKQFVRQRRRPTTYGPLTQ